MKRGLVIRPNVPRVILKEESFCGDLRRDDGNTVNFDIMIHRWKKITKILGR
jgi:hypothetical protein